ncbi:MAG: hypothetical protein RMJ67_08880 [Elusimicrobiota bacterium]|nr:hypothetical protein [Endomicrobiia bacterium]MDW8166610.1 hypothetical protein [Elusimicrobiota bacterium]
MKAISLISGGLDSELATRIILEEFSIFFLAFLFKNFIYLIKTK